ncbi:DUF2188 domain-containing protein [Mycobacterium sp. CSUR Q5927]|nr:DUF2188 domain-containing protein [Mycobacterium sp. CSUR Q5927]
MNRQKIDPAKVHFDENTVVEDVDLAEEEIIVDGKRLTDERADAIARDVLAKVRARTLVPGGKSLSGEGKHSPVVQVRVSETTRNALQEIAHARSMSVSKLSRQVLDEFVSKQVSVSNLSNRPMENVVASGPNSREVVPNPDGGWDVKKPGASRASAHYDTQSEAVDRARQILQNDGGGELRTHGRDGQIRASDTIPPGNDPYPPRG